MRPEEGYGILSIRESNMQVIEYVRYLQEKVQKYEGPYQGWPADPTKSMPWRNSHWQVQNLVGHPQALSNGSGMGPVFPAKLDDNGIAVTSSMIANPQHVMDPDSLKDAAMMQQADLLNKDGYPDLLRHFQTASVPALHSDGINAHHHPLQQPLSNPQSAECPMTADILHQQEELAIEGGTINISSAYSEGLLNALTQALQTAGVDVSQANISLQIDLGKRAKDQTAVHPRDGTGAGDSDHVHKRMKM
ncbi:Transcription factor BIM2 [Linum grandiflorum]